MNSHEFLKYYVVSNLSLFLNIFLPFAFAGIIFAIVRIILKAIPTGRITIKKAAMGIIIIMCCIIGIKNINSISTYLSGTIVECIN